MHLNQELAIQPDPPDLTSEDSGGTATENLILLESHQQQQPSLNTGGRIEAAGTEGCENTHFVVNSSSEAPSGATTVVVVDPSTTANQNTTLSTMSSCEGPFSEELIQYDTRL